MGYARDDLDRVAAPLQHAGVERRATVGKDAGELRFLRAREAHEGGDAAADRPVVPRVSGALRRVALAQSPERLDCVLEHVDHEQATIRRQQFAEAHPVLAREVGRVPQ